jgi:ATP-dependent Clp protease ATP-binding subunit ClpB
MAEMLLEGRLPDGATLAIDEGDGALTMAIR